MLNDPDQHDTLPPAIVQALRGLDGPAVLPDTDRDADVLSGARRHLATLHRKRRNRHLFFAGGAGGALAAAAMVGLVVWLGGPAAKEQADAPVEWMAMDDAEATITEDTPNSPPRTAARQGDLDASGSVDILDAYALARRIGRGEAGDALDLDGSGSVDQRDIDWVANRAVALDHGEQG